MSTVPARTSDTQHHRSGPVRFPAQPHVDVFIPYVPGQLRGEVVRAVNRAGWTPQLVPTPPDDPYAYADAFRAWWRAGREFIVVEQGALTRPELLWSMPGCLSLVCSRPHDCRRPGMRGTLACLRVSAAAIARDPELADRVLARRNGEVWWRHGMLTGRPYSPGAATPHGLDHACVSEAAAAALGPFPGPRWPTTQPWGGMDVMLMREFGRAGLGVHYHRTPSVHLAARPANTHPNRLAG